MRVGDTSQLVQRPLRGCGEADARTWERNTANRISTEETGKTSSGRAERSWRLLQLPHCRGELTLEGSPFSLFPPLSRLLPGL